MSTNASGMSSQMGFAAEATPGTRQVPTRFNEFNSETLQFHQNRIESEGIRAGRRIQHRWAPGASWVDGGIVQELGPQNTALWLKHCIGSNVTAGAGPYTHTITPGPLDALTLTVQILRPDISATDRVFDYCGLSVVDWALAAEVDAYLMLTTNMYGTEEKVDQALAAASYPATYSPFVYTHGALTIAGSAYDVKQFQMGADNGLATGRHQIRATTPTFPKTSKESGIREITGSLTSDFVDLTAYNRFKNGTESALVMTFDAGAAAKLVITCNVRWDGDTPTVPGKQLLEQPLRFKCVSGTSDAAAFTAVVTNSDSAA